jgi:hypothetical protein
MIAVEVVGAGMTKHQASNHKQIPSSNAPMIQMIQLMQVTLKRSTIVHPDVWDISHWGFRFV